MLRNVKHYTWITLFLLLPGLNAAAPEYYQVKAMPGDGVYSIMRRYELNQHSCNFQQFYQLNQLKKGARLIAGKKYYVPILIYTFNGKTIRSSIDDNDWNKAVRIQEYNEQMLAKELRSKAFQKDKILWVPYHELHCGESDIKVESPVSPSPEAANPVTSTGKRKFPIFGTKYAYTPLVSNKLKGKVYYIVSGHGGPDPGAMTQRGSYTLCEDEYAYDVALRMCRNLVAHGATAYMINRDKNDGIRDDKYLACDYDEVLWGDIKMMRQQKPRLIQRSNVINELYDRNRLAGVTEQVAIMVHVDSRAKGERKDVYFYYHPSSSSGRSVALSLHRALKRRYKQHRASGQYHGTVSSRDLHMLRENKPTSVYIELANIKNTFDQQRVILSSNRQALADWLVEGLMP